VPGLDTMALVELLGDQQAKMGASPRPRIGRTEHHDAG